MSLRLGRLLPNKRSLWRGTKTWRLSVEDPFEAFDSAKPHDLAQVTVPHSLPDSDSLSLFPSYRAFFKVITREGQLRLAGSVRDAVAAMTRASTLGIDSNASAQRSALMG